MAIADFAPLMKQTVTVKAKTSRDSHGKPTFGSGTDWKARVAFKAEWLRDPEGRAVLAKGAVWFLGAPAVTVEDQITLPDGTTPPILFVERPPDQTGAVHHTKVVFG